jgi:CBS domain-containing protein
MDPAAPGNGQGDVLSGRRQDMSILVRHAMTESPETVDADASVNEVARLMKDKDVG